MARIQNAADLTQKPTITSVANGIEIVFPKFLIQKKLKVKSFTDRLTKN
jgi:hypothetical protein